MDYARLHQALTTDTEGVVRQWAEAFRQSRLRLPRPDTDQQLLNLAMSLVEGLALAVPGPNDPPQPLAPGSAALRELEKAVAFAGALMAAGGLSGFDTAAAILALRHVARGLTDKPQQPEIDGLFEWLVVMAMDSFSSAKAMAAAEKMREQVERGTPVVTVAPEVPAAILFGHPEEGTLDAIFGRLVLQVVRIGAKTAIVDVTRVEDHLSPPLLSAMRRFLGHRKVAPAVQVLVIGLDGDERRVWQDVATSAEATVTFPDRFEDAVRHGLERAGFRLVR